MATNLRLGFVFALSGLALVAGGGRLVWIQATRGEALRSRATGQERTQVVLPAVRGSIFDTRGRVLAATVRRPSIFADPALISNFAFESAAVGDALGLDPQALEVELLAHRSSRFRWVKRMASDAEGERIRELRHDKLTRAFGVQMEPQRAYPQQRVAAHVLGFVGADGHGLAGIEQAYDDVLRGRPGRRISVVDARRRRRVRTVPEAFEPPVDGSAVVLTIDLNIQQRVEQELRAAFDEFHPDWAAAVVLDPRSGEVLASAVLPDFDPADPIPDGLDDAQLAAAREHLRNRVVADAYEPGSIFKPFIAGLAYDAGLVGLDEPFEIRGPVRSFGGRLMHDTHAYDTLRLYEIVGFSSNIGMGLIGARVGNARLCEFVRRLGFGDPTGIGLPGESPGMLYPLQQWTRFSTQSIPIGQEVAATPIQLATAFAVFCNDGVLYRPRIVRGVVAPDGSTRIDNSRPIAIRRVMASDTARSFRLKALRHVVTDGTARRLADNEYALFGKTGTAQIAAREGGGYEPDAYVGSFVCGGPVDDPRVVVLVSIYHPHGGKYYGGTVAAPAAARIASSTLAYLKVAPRPRATEPTGGVQ